MTIYRIKDADGNVTNAGIQADETFMAANFEYYEAVTESAPTLSAEDTAKLWRNEELTVTDYIIPLSDHPQHAAYITYRAALRAWPSTSDFPDTRPELGS